MKPACKRCLLEGISQSRYEETVEEYIASLPPETKADSATMRNRLSICARCEHLLEGMCRICGCFVKARAAKQTSRCPAVQPKW